MNTRIARTTMLAVIACAAPAALVAQDSFGYTASGAVPYSYQNIASTGTSILAGSDDATATITLPFAFRYYGVNYSSVCVSTNGILSFGACVPNDFTNLDITAQSPGGDAPLVAPFWMDLSFSSGSGSIIYQTLGAAGSRQFIVQWNNCIALNAPGDLNFEAILKEGSNQILFQYLSVETGNNAVSRGAGATVGIRNSNGHTNGQRIQWSFRAPVLTNRSAILFTPPATAGPVDVSGQVRATTTAFVYNRLTQNYTGTLTIQNTGTSPIAAPITVVLTQLTSGVTATNAAGTRPEGPFYNASTSAPLGPGQSIQVPLVFRNPANALITFVAKTHSGSF